VKPHFGASPEMGKEKMMDKTEKRRPDMKYRFLLMVAAVLLWSCSGRAPVSFSLDGGTDSDSDADTDSDTDSDSDTDTDTDSLDCAGGRYDESTGLCWQHPRASGTYEWYEATDYCDGLDLAGHTNWYLPSRNHFIELLGDCDSNVMSGDTGYCNSCDESGTCSALFGSVGGLYWSSSLYDDNRTWIARFNNGRVYYVIITSDMNVRCVRPGP